VNVTNQSKSIPDKGIAISHATEVNLPQKHFFHEQKCFFLTQQKDFKSPQYL
jgi:hypothetical protein